MINSGENVLMEWFRPCVVSSFDDDEGDAVVAKEERVETLVVAGFPNVGNTCFAAASLQFLKSAANVSWNDSSFLCGGKQPDFASFLRDMKLVRPGEKKKRGEECVGVLVLNRKTLCNCKRFDQRSATGCCRVLFVFVG